MVYHIKLHPTIFKFLNKVEKGLSTRIKNKLKLLKNEPFRYLEHYEGQDVYKLRIGQYRALIDINLKKKVILVRYINHRKNIYKK